MKRTPFRLLPLLLVAVLGATACPKKPPEAEKIPEVPAVRPPVPIPAPPGPPAEAPPEAKLPPPEPRPPIAETVEDLLERCGPRESPDFSVTRARSGDTAESLAAHYLRAASKAWMIEEYAGARTFSDGQEVIIPKREWNPVGVFPWGYQLVPVLVYHNIGREQKGRVVILPQRFEEQMRHLKAEGFHAVSIRDFLDFAAGRRQLPRKSVLLAFDDGWRSFLQHARPLLKQLGFTATLFVYTDFIGGREAFSWRELRTLLEEGLDVQAHSKTHSDLRRNGGESDAEYMRRMEAELGQPLALFQKHLGRGSAALAYPYGYTDEELIRYVSQRGYVLGFTVRRQANPAFAFPLRMGRSQIYGEMNLQDFAKNLNVFHDEHLSSPGNRTRRPAGSPGAAEPATVQPKSTEQASSACARLADTHNTRSDMLERRGYLRQALEERVIALTIDSSNGAAQAARLRLEAEIEREVSALTDSGRELLARGLHAEARRRLLAALALDPTNRMAFETLQNQVQEVTFLVHTVRRGETLASLADLYYGDRSRAEVIAETNRLALNARLAAGQPLRIPEIPGVPFLPH